MIIDHAALVRWFCAFVASASVSAQPADWPAMDITASAAAQGEVPEYFVIRVASSGDALADQRAQDVLMSMPGVDSAREVAEGVRIGTSTYSLVHAPSPVRRAALFQAAASTERISVSPVLAGSATANDPANDLLPNDPLIGNQYAMFNDGQDVAGVPGLAGADINVAQAWQLQRGSAQVRVAVLDSGVSATHPDLVAKLDDGLNVTGGSAGDTDAPLNSHGTHIAGIVAASTNNGEGVVGVSWGSRIVPIKAANPLGFTSDVWLAEGLVWAADTGVDIAVMSFGLNAPSDVLADAVSYAADRGVIMFASTGNNGSDGVLYPAAYPEVIAVGATDNTDLIAPFSNRGGRVDFVAPGVDIFSTRHTMFEPHTYGYASGTSMSTPVVAGVAALLRSASPLISTDEVRDVLARTSRDLGAFGKDAVYGFGRVNAHRAVQHVLGVPWCYADVDGDGSVRPPDFSRWVSLYASGDLRCDQNLNGTVEPGDFNAFLLNYSLQEGECGSH